MSTTITDPTLTDASAAPALQLAYSFIPSTKLIYTDSTISLQIIITNQTQQGVTLSAIEFSIPWGQDAQDLANSAMTYDDPDGWTIDVQGGNVTLTPANGDNGTINESIDFTLSNIVVNDLVGQVNVTYNEFGPTPGKTESAPGTYYILKQTDTYPISSFTATPNPVDITESITLNWTCRSTGSSYSYDVSSVPPGSPALNGCLDNSNDCYDCATGASGITVDNLRQDTVYQLVIYKDGGVFGTVETKVYVNAAAVLQNHIIEQYLGGYLLRFGWLTNSFTKSCTVALGTTVLGEALPADTYDAPMLFALPSTDGTTELAVSALPISGTVNGYGQFGQPTAGNWITHTSVTIGSGPIAAPMAITPNGVNAVACVNNELYIFNTGGSGYTPVVIISAADLLVSHLTNQPWQLVSVATTLDNKSALVAYTLLGNAGLAMVDLASYTATNIPLPAATKTGEPYFAGGVAVLPLVSGTNPTAVVTIRPLFAENDSGQLWTIVEVDLVEQKVIQTSSAESVDVGTAVAVTPDGLTVLAAHNVPSDGISIIQLSDFTCTNNITTNVGYPNFIAADETYTYIASGDNGGQLVVADTASATVQKQIQLDSNAHWVGTTTDGYVVIVACNNSVNAVDVEAEEVYTIALPTTTSTLEGFAATPDGKTITWGVYDSSTGLTTFQSAGTAELIAKPKDPAR